MLAPKRMTTMRSEEAITLFMPVDTAELELIRQSGFRAFPPRLPEQPIFYPVLTEDYAVKSRGTGMCQPPAPGMSLGSPCWHRIWLPISHRMPAVWRIANIGFRRRICRRSMQLL